MIYLGLLLFFVFEYLRPTSYIPALLPLHLNSLIPIAVTAGALLKEKPVGLQDLLADTNTKLIGAWFGLLLISMVTADVTEYAYQAVTTVVGYVFIFVAIQKLATDLRRVKGLFVVLVGVHIAVASLNPQIFTSGDREYLASGFFLGDGNDFALSVNIAIPLCVFLLFDAKARARPFWLIVLTVLVGSVIVTQSRGGTIALGVVGFFFWLRMDRKALIAALGVVAVMGVLVLAPPSYFQRMNTLSTQEGSAQGRILAWQASMRMALDHPVFGVGAGGFAPAYGARYLSSPNQPQATAHSIYFLTLGELGLPGLILLVSAIVWNLSANRRLTAEIQARDPMVRVRDIRLLASTSAALLAFAVGGAFLSAIYYPHFYVLAGLLSASRRVVLAHSAKAPEAGVRPVAQQTHVSIHWALQPKAPARNLGPSSLPARR